MITQKSSADTLFWKVSLTIIWMSSIKEGCYKPRLYVSVNLLAAVWPPSCATLSSSFAHSSNTASPDNHAKINSWVSSAFLYGYGYGYGAPLGGPSRPIGLLELRYKHIKSLVMGELYCSLGVIFKRKFSFKELQDFWVAKALMSS